MLMSSSFTSVLTRGTGVVGQHLRSRRVAQYWPVGVHGAGEPPISQAIGEKQIESFCFKLVAFKLP